MTEAELANIERLYRVRPRNRFARLTAIVMAALVIVAWLIGDFFAADVFSARRWSNLQRFVGELRPYPLQGESFEWSLALQWAWEIFTSRGWQAVVTTLAISVAAIVLASIGGALLTLPAARNVATAEPFLIGVGKRSRWSALVWKSVVGVTRLLMIFLRAIPEYVWAFLLLALIGPTAWPAVLALALHNTGILGKLSAEVVEDLPSPPLMALRALGASRLQISATAIFPLALPRFLLFFFYRWETCVREATVLGMLGIVSLGFWIQDARARNFYDEMFFLVLLGALLVLLGDIVSAVARAMVRKAS